MSGLHLVAGPEDLAERARAKREAWDFSEARIREIVREEIAWALQLSGRAVEPSPRAAVAVQAGETIAAARRRERFAAMSADYEAGMPTGDVAVKYGVCRETVYRALDANGIDRDRNHVHFANYDAIAADYRAGLTLLQCATKHKCQTDTVKAALVRLGVPTRPRGKASRSTMGQADRLARFIARREAGATLEQIAAENGITRERVRQILNKAGIDTHVRQPTDEEKAVVADYVAGENLTTAAAKLGIGEQSFKDVVTRCGHTPRKRERRTDARVDELCRQAVALRRQGMKHRDIAAQLNLPGPEIVYRYLNRAKGKWGDAQ